MIKCKIFWKKKKKNLKVGPNVYIGNGVKIGKGTRVMNSIVLEGTEVKVNLIWKNFFIYFIILKCLK